MRTAGRGFGIFHEMWRSYGTIIERGIAADAADPTTLQEPYVFVVSQCHQTLL